MAVMTIQSNELEFWDDIFARYLQVKGHQEGWEYAFNNAGRFADLAVEERRERNRIEDKRKDEE